MTALADYAKKYETIRIERRDGILQLTLHTDGGPEAKETGLVNEVLPRERLLPRGWELAADLAEKPPLVLRYTRLLVTD